MNIGVYIAEGGMGESEVGRIHGNRCLAPRTREARFLKIEV